MRVPIIGNSHMKAEKKDGKGCAGLQAFGAIWCF